MRGWQTVLCIFAERCDNLDRLWFPAHFRLKTIEAGWLGDRFNPPAVEVMMKLHVSCSPGTHLPMGGYVSLYGQVVESSRVEKEMKHLLEWLGAESYYYYHYV